MRASFEAAAVAPVGPLAPNGCSSSTIRAAVRSARGAADRRSGGADSARRYCGLATQTGEGSDEARTAPGRQQQSRPIGEFGRVRIVGERRHVQLSDYDQHPADTASETFGEKDLSILEQLEAELEELQAALARVDDGTYGVDEVTGEPIDPERLEALPTARTNIAPDDRAAR